MSYKMGEERWCLAICHTNYQEIDLFRVGHTNRVEKVGVLVLVAGVVKVKKTKERRPSRGMELAVKKY